MLAVLRAIGMFNAAIWLGAAVFFTFGVAPTTFNAEMALVFPRFYVGIVGQQMIGAFFTFNWICALIALLHFAGEVFYARRKFNRFNLILLLVLLGIGLGGQQLLAPEMKVLHHRRYLGPVAERGAAETTFKRLHAVSSIGNLLALAGLFVYSWRVFNPPPETRFVSTQKFRG